MKSFMMQKNYEEEVASGNLEEAIMILKKQICLNLINFHKSFEKEEIKDVIELFNLSDYELSKELEDVLSVHEEYTSMLKLLILDKLSLEEQLEIFVKIDKELRMIIENKKHLK